MAQQVWPQGSLLYPQQQQPQLPGTIDLSSRLGVMNGRTVPITLMPPYSPPCSPSEQIQLQQQGQERQLVQPQLQPQQQFFASQQAGQMPLWGMPSLLPYPQNCGQSVSPGFSQYGVPTQPGPCNSCSEGSACCCSNGPLEVYICGPPPMGPGCLDGMRSCFDCTYLLMVVCALLSLLGFLLLLVLGRNDDLFYKFGVRDTEQLQKKIGSFILDVPCTPKKIIGVSGTICMKDYLNAHSFVTQLASFTLQRNILYFLAMIFSISALIYATIVDFRRRKNEIILLTNSNSILAQQQQQQQSRDQQQLDKQPIKGGSLEEGQGHDLSRKTQKKDPEEKQQQKQQPQKQDESHAVQLPQTLLPSNRGTRVYNTPFYEFMRVAWFVMGVAVFFWVANLFYFSCTLLSFYKRSTTGELHEFFNAYILRFSSSLVCVTVYLAWPLVNIFVEFALWIVFFLPWVFYRTMCKPGIGNLRPDLPLHKVPGCIRLDMFFMEFNDVSRLGFSSNAWKILTGGTTPFIQCCENATADRDPLMTQWHQRRYEWLARMQGLYPLAARVPGVLPGVPGVLPGVPGAVVDPAGTTAVTVEEDQEGDDSGSTAGGRRRRKHSSRRRNISHEHRGRSRHRHDEDVGELNGEACEGGRRHRRRSNSHHHHHHRSDRHKNNESNTENVPVNNTSNNATPSDQQNKVVMNNLDEL